MGGVVWTNVMEDQPRQTFGAACDRPAFQQGTARRSRNDRPGCHPGILARRGARSHGDLSACLGWRPQIRRTALCELASGGQGATREPCERANRHTGARRPSRETVLAKDLPGEPWAGRDGLPGPLLVTTWSRLDRHILRGSAYRPESALDGWAFGPPFEIPGQCNGFPPRPTPS